MNHKRKNGNGVSISRCCAAAKGTGDSCSGPGQPTFSNTQNSAIDATKKSNSRATNQDLTAARAACGAVPDLTLR